MARFMGRLLSELKSIRYSSMRLMISCSCGGEEINERKLARTWTTENSSSAQRLTPRGQGSAVTCCVASAGASCPKP